MINSKGVAKNLSHNVSKEELQHLKKNCDLALTLWHCVAGPVI